MCVPWELNPRPFALLTQCSTTEPQEATISYTIKNLTTLHFCWFYIVQENGSRTTCSKQSENHAYKLPCYIERFREIINWIRCFHYIHVTLVNKLISCRWSIRDDPNAIVSDVTFLIAWDQLPSMRHLVLESTRAGFSERRLRLYFQGSFL